MQCGHLRPSDKFGLNPKADARTPSRKGQHSKNSKSVNNPAQTSTAENGRNRLLHDVYDEVGYIRPLFDAYADTLISLLLWHAPLLKVWLPHCQALIYLPNGLRNTTRFFQSHSISLTILRSTK